MKCCQGTVFKIIGTMLFAFLVRIFSKDCFENLIELKNIYLNICYISQSERDSILQIYFVFNSNFWEYSFSYSTQEFEVSEN